MKKKYVLFCTILMMSVVMAGCGQSGNEGSTTALSKEEARNKVLAAAGVSEEDVKDLQIKKEEDNGRYVYDIEFYAGDKEYDYEIDIYSQEIISRGSEAEDDFLQ